MKSLIAFIALLTLASGMAWATLSPETMSMTDISAAGIYYPANSGNFVNMRTALTNPPWPVTVGMLSNTTIIGGTQTGANVSGNNVTATTTGFTHTLADWLGTGPIQMQTTFTGSPSFNGGSWNFLYVPTDTATVGGAFLDTLKIISTQGTGMTGGRNVFEVFAQHNGTSGAGSTNRNYVGAAITSSANANDGGTGGAVLGAVFSLNPVATLQTGATNYAELSGGEVDVGIQTGASAYYKSGWSIVLQPNDAVQGSTFDCAICISSQGSTVGWKNGIQFGGMNGALPMASTGTLFDLQGSQTIANGVNLNGWTITGFAFESPGWSVSGTGVESALQLNTTGGTLGGTIGNTTTIAGLFGATSNNTGLRITNFRYGTGADWTTASTRVQEIVDASSFGYIEFNGPTTGAGGVALIAGSTGVSVSSFPAVTVSAPILLTATYTVGTLPTCNSGVIGFLAAVSDANSPTYNGTLSGSGAGATAHVMAYCNGTNWTAH
jgi:hypothetical protein